jgi:MHS family citrate/tricarballylate:H+ symporter-like MFS transporter
MAPSKPSNVLSIFRATSGNFFEMFDFFLFGFYAPYIAQAFFPAANEVTSLLLTFLTFGAGFLMRPLGAIVLGTYSDRVGRRAGLIVSLSIMAVGTAMVAVCPTYASIGLAAPLIVLVARLLQGFSAGAELAGVSVYLSELAPEGRRGLYVSWQSASQQVAVMTAASIGFGLNKILPQSEIAAWGWRIPFFVGCLIVPFVLVLRRSLRETEAFLAQKQIASTLDILGSLVRNWRMVLTGLLLVLMTSVSFYLITVYTPAFGKKVLGLSETDSLIVTFAVGLSNFFWVPTMGAISDRVGRKPLLVGFTALAMATAYPLTSWLVAAPSFPRMLEVMLWLSFIFGGYNGAMIVTLTELVPVQQRTSGFSIAYGLAVAIGGFTPAISTFLIEMTGDKASPAWCMTVAAACAFTATFAVRGSVASKPAPPAHIPGMLDSLAKD